MQPQNYLFMVGSIIYMTQFSHFLMMLLSLEMMLLATFLCLMIKKMFFSNMFLMVLTLMVCGGAFGLSVLIGLTRKNSSDSITFYHNF